LKYLDRQDAAGTRYKTFAEFMSKRPADKPFCFWFGSWDAHRPYTKDSGVKSGMNPDKVTVPASLPDVDIVRRDMCDYYFEVQRFDRRLGGMLDLIEKSGELDNTMVVISGDNGLPFPRCKVELYDTGTQVPLAVAWPAGIKGGRVVDDFVNLAELAPTFMEAAGLKPLDTMTTKSFLNVLLSDKSGQVDALRDRVFTGRGYHDYQCRAHDSGYPSRAMRTADFLYIRNYESDRWPSGDPVAFRKNRGKYGEVDRSPTKTFLLEHQNDPTIAGLFKLSMAKRPYEELYDLSKDPHQLKNLANNPEYTATIRELTPAFEAKFTTRYNPVELGIPPRPQMK
jgi:N-sulfoglucosamine sulfohydrolase